MATIQIADPIRPLSRTNSYDVVGGVVNLRATSVERTRTRSLSRDVSRSRPHHERLEHGEDGGLRQSGDFKQKQV